MALDFSNIVLQTVDITTNAKPDMYVSSNRVTFTKKVADDMNYPAFIQFCIDPNHKILALRVCRANEHKAFAFSKSRSEQKSQIILSNRNLRDMLSKMIDSFDDAARYKFTGQYDLENKIMYFDLTDMEIIRNDKTEEDDGIEEEIDLSDDDSL